MGDISLAMAETIRAYHQKGWSPATSTNYSYRSSADDKIINVSRSGLDKSAFRAEDFMCVDFDGKPTFGFEGIRPSAETLIHCVLYQLFPESTVILHSHSKYSVLMSQLVDKEISFSGYEIQKGFKGQTTHDATVSIPVIDNTQDMVEFSEWMRNRKDEFNCHCFIIRNHGTYAWGDNLFEAKRHIETLEYLLEVEFEKMKIK